MGPSSQSRRESMRPRCTRDPGILALMGSPPSTIGPYRIVRLLGEGGMGYVYEGIHETIERRVAIKLLKSEFAKSPEALTRFFNEARIVNRIEHESLVEVSDHGQMPDGTVFLVMEYVRGEMLRTRLNRLQPTGQRIAMEQTVTIMWQVAEALAAAHDKGVVHRDLKPDNIMLVPASALQGGERVKILDFGIAKLLQASQVVTLQSRMMGTPLYMSPEQCRSATDLDGRSDVYALGVMLYELLAGRPPFYADKLEALLAQHLFFEPDPLNQVAPQTLLRWQIWCIVSCGRTRGAAHHASGRRRAGAAPTRPVASGRGACSDGSP